GLAARRPLSVEHRRWPLAGLGEGGGDVAHLAVVLLGYPAQFFERLVRREMEPLHEDALGLADDIPAHQGLLEAFHLLVQRLDEVACRTLEFWRLHPPP